MTRLGEAFFTRVVLPLVPSSSSRAKEMEIGTQNLQRKEQPRLARAVGRRGSASLLAQAWDLDPSRRARLLAGVADRGGDEDARSFVLSLPASARVTAEFVAAAAQVAGEDGTRVLLDALARSDGLPAEADALEALARRSAPVPATVLRRHMSRRPDRLWHAAFAALVAGWDRIDHPIDLVRDLLASHTDAEARWELLALDLDHEPWWIGRRFWADEDEEADRFARLLSGALDRSRAVECWTVATRDAERCALLARLDDSTVLPLGWLEGAYPLASARVRDAIVRHVGRSRGREGYEWLSSLARSGPDPVGAEAAGRILGRLETPVLFEIGEARRAVSVLAAIGARGLPASRLAALALARTRRGDDRIAWATVLAETGLVPEAESALRTIWDEDASAGLRSAYLVSGGARPSWLSAEDSLAGHVSVRFQALVARGRLAEIEEFAARDDEVGRQVREALWIAGGVLDDRVDPYPLDPAGELELADSIAIGGD